MLAHQGDEAEAGDAARRGLEALLAILHVRWHAFLEVAVRRPGRGWIDAALHDPGASLLVATELQSELRRLEQIVRWSAEKAASLPSWDGWVGLGSETQVSLLLMVRRTRATRAVAGDFAAQIQAAYPAHPDDALAVLAGTAPWPGPSLVWAVVDAGGRAGCRDGEGHGGKDPGSGPVDVGRRASLG